MKRIIVAGQDGFARLVGLDPARRTPLVHEMLHPARGDAAGYWLQIVIATALATLGLALDSTAVVIGAMLIAPLMRPIVELAMGLATGSPPLVFRTGIRAVTSIVVVVAASTAFSRMLPFHEVTRELQARMVPSLLDLFVAAACALAGAYAVVIASNSVATTAAGTSIGISLVPPLCTAGYGISIGDWSMASGAALLFTANVSGIVAVASALFVLAGFGQVDIRQEESSLDEDASVGAAARIGRSITRQGKLGALTRILIPLVLVGGVAVPLKSAVDDMSHRSRVRKRVAELMAQTSSERIVQYTLEQGRRVVVLRVVVVGEPGDAHVLEERLRAELVRLGEKNPRVAVWAVSDAQAMAALSERIDDIPALLSKPDPPPPPPPSLERRLRAQWPAQSVGTLLGVWTADGPPPRARVAHLAPELGPAGCELLARSVAQDGHVPELQELVLAPIEPGDGGIAPWLERALALLARADDFPDVRFCIGVPPPPPRGRRDPIPALVRDALTIAARHPNATIVSSGVLRLEPSLEDCPEADAPNAQPPRSTR